MRLTALVVVLAACQPQSEVSAIRSAEGELKSGFPNAWERALFMAANRARSDPATVKGAQSTVLPARAPLVLDFDLERSSRFHATMLEKGQAPLMHPSPCVLKADVGTSGCDGDPACGCQAAKTCLSCGACAAGTDPFARIGMFRAAGGGGEIAAAGYGDPWAVMDGWVDEAAGADGHRQIVDGDYGLVGFGHAEGASGACWPTFDVGDFAFDKPAPAKLAGAAPKPIGGGAGTYRVYATWSDPALGAPATITAVVDGACTTMTLELGAPSLNATYYADVALAAGCHAVYVLGRDASNTRVTWPSTTAFTIDVGGGACAGEMPQPQAACDGTLPPDLGGAPPVAGDDGGTTPPGTPGTPGNPGNPANPGTPPSSDPSPTAGVQGGCSTAPGAPASSAALVFALAALAFALRRA